MLLSYSRVLNNIGILFINNYCSLLLDLYIYFFLKPRGVFNATGGFSYLITSHVYCHNNNIIR